MFEPEQKKEVVSYVLMRTDLNMTPGKMIAQACHGMVYMIDWFTMIAQEVQKFKLEHKINFFETDPDKAMEPEFKEYNFKLAHCVNYSDWINSGMTKVVLRCTNTTLDAFMNRANRDKIMYFTVHDLGRTQVPENTLTCVTLFPYVKTMIRDILSECGISKLL